ncbi:hypothetical protein [Tautonia plasticadhaerens]|uniref:Uncharacterized protein n=1 Tax=Tautonia plasticadhaerens TaxID=2527974 RepID=A0A518H6S1_9BACT|nr:hypothetical protein [Tautonia plasticadhaerens]QDV36513.1 hypothetical protein ElP_44390 [Tautonia plasticadhaerens]
MASTRQIEANRRNAAKSTGPRTAEGKARVSRNALSHGLAGHGVVLTDEQLAAVEERKRDWFPDYRPDSPAERWRFERICIESVRLDTCLHRAVAARDELARRASEAWDEDRALDAERLASRLPGRPELVQPELLQSRHGVLWLLDRWECLRDAVARRPAPTDRDWSLLLDLLGVPADDRDDAPRRLIGEAPEADGFDAIAAEAVADLRRRLDAYLDDRDDRARVDAEAGLAPDAPAVVLLDRYEDRILRRLRQAEADLRRLQGRPASPDRPRLVPGPSGVHAPPSPPASPARPSSAHSNPADRPPPSPPTDRPPSRPDHASTPSRSSPDARPDRPRDPASPDPSPRNRRERRALRAMARHLGRGVRDDGPS